MKKSQLLSFQGTWNAVLGKPCPCPVRTLTSSTELCQEATQIRVSR